MKYSYFSFLLSALMLSLYSTNVIAQSGLRGDVNEDGKVDVADIAAIINIMSIKTSPISQESGGLDMVAHTKTGNPVNASTPQGVGYVNIKSAYDPSGSVKYKAKIEFADGCDDIYYHPTATSAYFATPQPGLVRYSGMDCDMVVDTNGMSYYSNGDYTKIGTIKGECFQFMFGHADGTYTSGIDLHNADDAIDKIRVFLPNPDYLLDGGTYKFKVKVYREEYEHPIWDSSTSTWISTGTNLLYSQLVQSIPLTVTKLMPTGLPQAFSLKGGQQHYVNPMEIYVKPVPPVTIPGGWSTDEATLKVPTSRTEWLNTQYWNVWMDGSVAGSNDVVTHAADIYPFDFADMFNDLDENIVANRSVSLDPDYAFEFMASDVDAAGNSIPVWMKAVSGTTSSTAFSFPSWCYDPSRADHFYSLPLIGKDAVSLKSTDKYADGTNAENKEVNVVYCYHNISLRKDATAPNGFRQGDYLMQTNMFPVSGGSVTTPFTVKYRNALDVNLFDLVSEDQLDTESGITGTSASAMDYRLQWRMQNRFFLQIVDYENGYNMNSWAYAKDKIVKVSVADNLITTIEPQYKVKNEAPYGADKEFPLNRVVYNFQNYMGAYVSKHVYLQRAGLIPVGQSYWGTLAYLKDQFIPSLWDLINTDIVKVVPGSLTIDIQDYFKPEFVYNGSREHGIVLVPTDRDLLHPALTSPLEHKVTFDVVDCFGFTKTIQIQFFMLPPRIDQNAARQNR